MDKLELQTAIDNHLEPTLLLMEQNEQKQKQLQKQLKKEHSKLKDELNELAYAVGKADNVKLTSTEKNWAAHYMYWKSRHIRPSWLIHSFFGVDSNHTPKYIDPLLIPSKCNECGRTFGTEIKANSNNRIKIHDKTPDWICKRCKDEAWEQTKKERKREHEKTFEVNSVDTDESRLKELKVMPYFDYLQTPEWNERRKRAYRKAGYKCQLCGDKGKGLNAHHNSKESYTRRGEEWDSDLTVLCNDCNKRFHNDGKRLGVK